MKLLVWWIFVCDLAQSPFKMLSYGHKFSQAVASHLIFNHGFQEMIHLQKGQLKQAGWPYLLYGTPRATEKGLPNGLENLPQIYLYFVCMLYHIPISASRKDSRNGL